jgi:predicted RNA-binding Zn ribbon-like protein
MEDGMEPGGRAPAPGPLRLVQAFLNTVDIEDGPDLLATPDGLRQWLATRGLPGGDRPLSAPDVRRAVTLREALRSLAAGNNGAPVDPAAVELLNETAATTGVVVRFDPTGGAELVPAEIGIRGALGVILAHAYTAMVDGTWPRLKTCRNQECRWAFYDASKNRSGAWCTMANCGDKLKARAYRQRRSRESGVGSTE